MGDALDAYGVALGDLIQGLGQRCQGLGETPT